MSNIAWLTALEKACCENENVDCEQVRVVMLISQENPYLLI